MTDFFCKSATALLALFFFQIAMYSYASESQALQKVDLHELLKPFTNIQHIKLAYHEKRYSLFLKQAKRYNGYIEFTRPDQFIKQIEDPGRKKFIIQSDQLTIYSQNPDSSQASTKVVSLDDYPQFKQFKALFSGLLSGNEEKLSQYYQYDVKPLPDEQVLLTLTPHIRDHFIEKQPNISRKITIIFAHQQIKNITMSGFGGEKSVLSIDAVIEKQLTKIQ